MSRAPDLATLRRQATAARAAIARLGAATADLRDMAGPSLDDLTTVDLDDLAGQPATDDAVARALASLRTRGPDVPPVSARREPMLATRDAVVTAEEQPPGRTSRKAPPAGDLPRPAGAQLALLLQGEQVPGEARVANRAVPVASPERRMEARVAPPPRQRTALAQAGAERPIVARPVAGAVETILAGAPPAADEIADEILDSESMNKPTPRKAGVNSMLTSALARWSQRRARPSDRPAAPRPESALAVHRTEPASRTLEVEPPRRNALARLAAAGGAVSPQDAGDAPHVPAENMRQAGASIGHHATAEAIAQPVPAVPPGGHASDGDLGERLARILRREARRAGIDMSGGWP